MTDTNYQQSLPKRLRPKPIDLMGQCTKCCDLFTITAFLVPDSAGQQATVSETASLKWVYPRRQNQNDQESGPILIHKCTGKVKIYGHSYQSYQQQEDQPNGARATSSRSFPRYILPPSTRRYVTPRAVPAPTH